MSEPTEHTYTREMMVDRIIEIRDIAWDERSSVGGMPYHTQELIGDILDTALDVLKSP